MYDVLKFGGPGCVLVWKREAPHGRRGGVCMEAAREKRGSIL